MRIKSVIWIRLKPYIIILIKFDLFQVVLGFVCEADYKLVAKAMRDRVTAIKRQREKHRRIADEQQKKKEGVFEEEPELLSPRSSVKGYESHAPFNVQTPPTPVLPEPMWSPVTGLVDSGINGSFPAESEEPEADQHFHIRHTSGSSATCTFKWLQ